MNRGGWFRFTAESRRSEPFLPHRSHGAHADRWERQVPDSPLRDRKDHIPAAAGTDAAAHARGTLLRNQRDATTVLRARIALSGQVPQILLAVGERLGQVGPVHPRMSLP